MKIVFVAVFVIYSALQNSQIIKTLCGNVQDVSIQISLHYKGIFCKLEPLLDNLEY